MKYFKKKLGIILSVAVILQSFCTFPVFSDDSVDYASYEPKDIMVTGWRTEATFDDASVGYSMLSWKNPASEKLKAVSVYIIDDNGTETNVTDSTKAHYGNDSDYCNANVPSAIVRLCEGQSVKTGSVKYRLVFEFTDGEKRDIVYSDNFQEGNGVSLLDAEGSKKGASQYGFISNGPHGTVNNNSSYMTMASAGQMSISTAESYEGDASLKIATNAWPPISESAYDISSHNDFVNMETAYELTADSKYKVKMKVKTFEECKLVIGGSGGTQCTLPDTDGKWKEVSYVFTMKQSKFDVRTVGTYGGIQSVYIDDIRVYDESGQTLLISEDFERSSITSKAAKKVSDVAVSTDSNSVTVSWGDCDFDYVNIYEAAPDGNEYLRARVLSSKKSVVFDGLENGAEYTYNVKGSNAGNKMYAWLEGDDTRVNAVISESSENTSDKYTYEPGNIILDTNNVLSWKNPKSSTLTSVNAYLVGSETETDVTPRLTAVNTSGETVSITASSAIVSLANASDSTGKTCKARLVFGFSDGTRRSVIFEDTYSTSNMFIQTNHSATENPSSAGSYLNVDAYRNKAAVQVKLSNSVYHDGEKSLRLESNNVKGTAGVTIQFGGLTQGTTYNVDMWVNTIEEANIMCGSNQTISLENTGGEWKKISFTYVSSSSSFALRPFGACREVYIDDITFTPNGATSPTLVMGFETRNINVPSAVSGLTAYEGDGKVRLDWTKPSSTSAYYVNVYEKISAGGKEELVLRARLDRNTSNSVTIDNVSNYTEHTYVIKVMHNNYNYGLGVESEAASVSVMPKEHLAELGLVRRAESESSELRKMLAECNDLGVYPKYEKADVETVRVYAEKMREEYEDMKYDNIRKYFDAVDSLYTETCEVLGRYISGSALPVAIGDRDVISVKVKDGDVITTSSDGKETKSVNVGFCAFRSLDDDIEDFASIGFNTIQTDGVGKGPVHLVEYDENARDFVKNQTYADDELANIRKTLDICRERGIVVDAGIPVHYVDDTIADKSGASDFRSSGGSYGTFINFNPTSSTAKKMLKKYFEVYIPVLYEYKDVIASITFVNEPYFEAYDKSYYFDEWTEFLKNKYSSISELNTAYGKTYAAFEDVSMPETVPGRDKTSDGVYTSALHMDYRLFVTDIMYEFFEFCIDEIDGYTNGEIPCGVKTMQFFREYLARWNTSYPRTISYDYEKIAALFGINGTDTFTYFGDSALTIPAKMSWYDFMTSINDAPIVDSETHVSPDEEDADASITKGGDVIPFMSASIWMGAIHGCDMTETWLYADEEIASPYFGASFSRNPEALRELAHTTLDAYRLEKEISAFQNAERKTAILYSYECYMLNLQYEANKFAVYEMLTHNGQRPMFVTENSLDKLTEENIEVLVIPGNLILADTNTVDKLTDYANKGGKIIIIGNDTFSRDINNNTFGLITDYAVRNKVSELKKMTNVTLISADVDNDTAKTSFGDSVEQGIENVLESVGLLDIKLIDADTSEIAAVEWSAVELDGDILVSACNYSDSDINVYVTKDGEAVTSFDDIKNTEYDLSSIKLETNKPVLLKISNYTTEYIFTASDGKYAERISEGNYRAGAVLRNNSVSDGLTAVLIAAVYKDGCLYSVKKSNAETIGEGESKTLSIADGIDIPNTSNGEYEVKLMIWNDLGNIEPLSVDKSIYD